MRSAVKTVAVLGFDESGPLLLPSVRADLIHRRDIVTPHIIASFVPVKHKQLYRENTCHYQHRASPTPFQHFLLLTVLLKLPV